MYLPKFEKFTIVSPSLSFTAIDYITKIDVSQQKYCEDFQQKNMQKQVYFVLFCTLCQNRVYYFAPVAILFFDHTVYNINIKQEGGKSDFLNILSFNFL